MFSFPHVSSAEASSGSSVSYAHAPTCTASHAPGPCCSTGPHGGPHRGPHSGPNGAAHDPPIPCHATIWTTHADPHSASCHAQEVRVLMRFDRFSWAFFEGGHRFWSENQGRNGKPGNRVLELLHASFLVVTPILRILHPTIFKWNDARLQKGDGLDLVKTWVTVLVFGELLGAQVQIVGLKLGMLMRCETSHYWWWHLCRLAATICYPLLLVCLQFLSAIICNTPSTCHYLDLT
jgi:hypothetical protein